VPRRSRFAALVLAALALGAGCRSGSRGGPGTPAEVVATFALGAAAQPTPLATLPGGLLAIGERRTGRIVAVGIPGVPAPPGTGEPEEIAAVDIDPAAPGQRGLLGLVSTAGALFASWTRTGDGRLVVGRVLPAPAQLVWEGPVSSDLANGGSLAAAPDGRLLIGIGDLRQPERIDDPDQLNGKVLSLDPEGPADQRPLVLSGGWNNPFALAVDGATVWVADNAPGQQPERIGRAEPGAAPVELPGRRAPSALVRLGPGRLGLCGFLGGDLVAVDVSSTPAVGPVLARGACRTGAVALGGGLVAVSDGVAVRILRLRP